MRLSFIFPEYLWLLALVPAFCLLTWFLPRQLPTLRHWLSLLLRSMLVVSLVLALSGMQLIWPVGTVNTIFLLDTSDSVALSQRARAEVFIDQALLNKPEDSQAAVIVFGKQALVERTWSDQQVLGQISGYPGGSATDIEQALQLALAMLPAEGHKRLVVLSDGGETQGDALTTARLAASLEIPIDIVSMSGMADGLDVQITQASLPSVMREGQQLRLRLDLTSPQSTPAQLLVRDNAGNVLVDTPLDLQAGTNSYNVSLPAPARGFNRYLVNVQVPDDGRPENNRAEVYTFMEGAPRILLLEGQEGAAETLAQALLSTSSEFVVLPSDQLPQSLDALLLFDAVVLVDVPENQISKRMQSLLSQYVHDLGRGLMMVGGPQSFGAGRWNATPIEEALPVKMDLPTHLNVIPTSIVILVDVSGSMGSEQDGQSKISLAAQGAQNIAAMLRDVDDLTVIGFDSAVHSLTGPYKGTERDQAIRAIETSLKSGGGGINMFDGMTAAAEQIRKSNNPVRHIITITDGSDTNQHDGTVELVEKLRQENITVSTIAIGSGEHVPFIKTVASAGNGRTFLTENASEIPQILVGETEVMFRPYVNELPFRPLLNSQHPIVRNLSPLPELQGYVLATPRQNAQLLYVTEEGHPVLAAWQFGLGRSIAWTSDLQGRWAKELVSSGQFPRFAAQMMAWLLPTAGDQQLNFEAITTGSRLELRADLNDAQNQAVSGAQLRAQLLDASGNAIEVPLREVNVGQYYAALEDAAAGAYLVQLVAYDQQGQPLASVTAGATMPLSNEYHGHSANPSLLAELARVTQGQFDPEPVQVFQVGGIDQGAVTEIAKYLLWFALLLLPLDIAIRRLSFRNRRQAIPSAVPVPAVPAPAPATPQAVVAAPAAQAQAKAPSRKRNREEELERLREAQERARKRARGEDENAK